ncbi:MAG: type I-C CRISPR-associated protein Cas7/Csd2 [Blastocatellia bacterium]|nr:type I-C CRISPR-associated protein Cas7/Csd2 [Blastocatellia bacterium]
MNNRYDFVFLFDAHDANPNGDPDAGNLPRLDPETNHGLVTDVCLKRKIRNFVLLTKQNAAPHRIYVQEKAVLTTQRKDAMTQKDDSPRDWMCKNFYDVRTFGAVMSVKENNCGQVRGAAQLSFARSIDPVVTSEHAITRCAVETEKEAKDQAGDNRTMGRKFTVPYALYRCHGIINPFLAEQTHFTDDDLELLFTAIENAFQFDASAARPAGSMAARAVIVFKHDSQLGSAASHKLFDAVGVKKKDGIDAPRSFSDYEIAVDESAIPQGVTLIRRI